MRKKIVPEAAQVGYLLAVLLVATGCATSRHTPTRSGEQDRPWKGGDALSPGTHDYETDLHIRGDRLGLRSGRDFAGPDDIAAATGSLTLREALSRALRHNPELAALGWDVRIEEANALQSGRWPNPELEAEFENLGGSGELSGTDSTETTLQLSQLIELGGKRRKRVAVDDLQRDLATWDYEARRLDLLTEVTKAFIDTLANQERVSLAEDLVALASEAHFAMTEWVRAGKTSPVDETRARLQLASSRIALDCLEREYAASRKRLAALWGDSEPAFRRVEGDLYVFHEVPSEQGIADAVDGNPDIARWKSEFALREANITLARAEGIPDLEVGLGVRHENEIDDIGGVLGFSMTLPLFDRNQGRVLASERRLAKAAGSHRAAVVQVSSELLSEYEILLGAHQEAQALREQILPDAEATFLAVREAYEFGKIGYLDVLDSQRTFFETRAQYIESLTQFHKSVATIERLIGGPLPQSPETPIEPRKDGNNE